MGLILNEMIIFIVIIFVVIISFLNTFLFRRFICELLIGGGGVAVTDADVTIVCVPRRIF